jgi:hypothetical protein
MLLGLAEKMAIFPLVFASPCCYNSITSLFFAPALAVYPAYFSKTRPLSLVSLGTHAMFRKQNRSSYLADGRLADVLALIQVLALDSAAHRSEEGIASELQGAPR